MEDSAKRSILVTKVVLIVIFISVLAVCLYFALTTYKNTKDVMIGLIIGGSLSGLFAFILILESIGLFNVKNESYA
jgi:lipoprotein signal peptidase